MALACASAPRFGLLAFQNSQKLLLGHGHGRHSSLGLRIPVTGFTWKTRQRMIITCSIQPISGAAAAAARYFDILATHASQYLSTSASNYCQDLLIADLDPTTAKTAIAITGPFLSAFGFLFILRIVMSWYPKLPVGKFPYVIAYAPTEPLLRVTRKVIPPLGGVDVTPVVWFGLTSFLNEILVGPQGLLILLSQQIQSG